MVQAWLDIDVDKILDEIDIAMISCNIGRSTFTIKTLTPIYPQSYDAYIDQRFYCGSNFSAMRKQEKQTQLELEPILINFQQKGVFQRDEIYGSLKTVYESFQTNFEYLERLNFDINTDYMTKTYDGRLWLRELFLSE